MKYPPPRGLNRAFTVICSRAPFAAERSPQERSTLLREIVYIHETQFWWSRRHMTVRRTLYHTSCKMFQVVDYPRTNTLV